ncbi:MAG: shikimate kinase [Lachnospiraceae bacterium]|nr:shikimate kinase [Lachnospiraceae bacterium]
MGQTAADNKKYGLLGERLGHSYSPRIHARLHGFPYACYEIAPGDVAAFLRETDLDGINVTIPYKQTVLSSCTWLSETARRIGCVNTLVRCPDGWHGYNTDHYGFCAMLRQAGIDPAGRRTLVLGDGGASRTVRTVLRDLGAAEITVMTRHSAGQDRGQDSGETRRQTTGHAAGVSFDTYDHLQAHRNAEIIINTTPVGMYPGNGEALLDPADFPDCRGVGDLIYNPARSELLLRAERAGIPFTGGLHMLVSQAARSAELWLGRKIPEQEITNVREMLEREMQNIILIGMPGAGKTAVGKALAEKTGRPFLDADEELEKRTGRTISEIFDAEGEEGFRRYETGVLSELGRNSGCIIATGGGCVTRRENYPLLHQNGCIIWIRRDPAALPSDGRPLSRSRDLKEMYKERRPLYEEFADLSVLNDDSPAAAADRIVTMMKLQ